MRKINWKYPLQEILIIIIGILLALGINNWWGKKQNNLLGQEYLRALQEDVQIDRENINQFKLRTIDRIINPLDRALNTFLTGDPMAISIDTFLNDLQMSQYLNIYSLRTGTYEDLKSTGNLRLIQNQALRNDLHDYYDRHEYYKMYYESFLDDRLMNGEILLKKIPFRNLHHDLDLRERPNFKNVNVDMNDLLTDIELENAIYRSMVVNRWIIRSFDNMAGRAARIDSILTAEINK